MDLKKMNEINFHDADLYNYVRNGNDISFELKDGWNEDTYFKIELNDIRVEVMNNTDDLVSYTLDCFNNINEYGGINLYSGEFGKFEKNVDEGKYWLKLWIRYPYDLNIKTENIIADFKFDGMNVGLCDDYDDTGRLYIKFIASSINIIELYPVLKKYNRFVADNMNNLYKYKDKFSDDEFNFFSAYDLEFYCFYDLLYDNNNIEFVCRHMLNIAKNISVKFIDVSNDINSELLKVFVKNINDNNLKISKCLRFVDFIDNKYVFGLLKSNDEELVFSCRNIIYSGEKIN